MPTPTIAVTCAASDQGGESVAGGIYTAKLDQTEIYDGFVVPEQVTATADADGLAILNLWPNALGVNGSSYRITARNPDTGKKFFDASVVVPNNPCNLYQIIQNAPFPNVDSAQQALIDVQALVTIANQDVAATNADAQQAAADRLQTGEDRTAARDSAANALTSEQIVVAAQLDITANWSDKLATAAVQAGIATTGGNTATTQAGISTAQAGLAADAKVAAELARDASFITGPKYATEALGRADVADGVNFLVQGSGDIAALEYRRVNAGTVSTLIASYPSTSGVFMFRGQVATATDLNTLKTVGSYGLLAGNTYPNMPAAQVGRNCTLTVTDGWIAGGRFQIQQIIDWNSPSRQFTRLSDGAGSGAWEQVAVGSSQIAALAVGTAQLADLGVTAGKLAVGYDYTATVTTGSLDTYLTASTGYIVSGAVTNAPTASGFLTVRKWGGSGQFILQEYVDMATPGKIYYRAYGGGTWGAWFQPTPADLSVTTAKLTDLSVTGPKLAANAVTNDKLAANYDYTATITSGSLDTYLNSGGYIVSGTITNAPTVSGYLSVHRWGSSGQFVLQRYVDMTTPGKIYFRKYGGAWEQWYQPTPADLSVTTTKIADGNVTGPKLAPAIVDATKLSAKYDWVATITTGDVNDYATQSGGWVVAGAMANAPTGSGWLFVHKFGAAGNFILQRWHDFTDPSIFWVRKQYGGTWSAWAKTVQPQVLPKTGKKVVCMGDSITENGDYPVRLATLTGATVTNCGFGGSRLAFSTGDYAYLSFHKLADYIASGNYTELTDACARLAGSPVFDDNTAIAARLAAVDWAATDYIVAAYGTNDYGSPDVPLGVATDTTGATFRGAINHAVNKICTAYPHIKILFVSPIWRARYAVNGDGNDSDTYANSRGATLVDFVDAMKEMTALNKMPCIDMYRTSGVNKYTAPTLLSDGLHPVNGIGYQRVAEKVAAGLVANW